MRRTAAKALLLALGVIVLEATPSIAGNLYGWTVSASNSDPFVNTGSSAPGTRLLYLWYACNYADGLAAAEFDLAFSGGASFLGFTPAFEFTNLGTGASLQLVSQSGCLVGPMVAGVIQIAETGPGAVCLVASSIDGANVSLDCDPTNPGVWPNQTVGFSTGASQACQEPLCDPPDADLGVTKQVDDPAPPAGAAATYRITVTNAGPDSVWDAGVVDALPAGVTVQSSLASHGGYDAVAGFWWIGGLAVGDSATLDIGFVAAPGTVGQAIWNHAFLAGLFDDANPANDADSVAIVVAEPLIEASFPAVSADDGRSVVVPVSLANDQYVSSVTLRYRAGGSGGFNSAAMAQTAPGAWEATVPSSAVSIRGVQYFVEVVRTSAVTVRLPEAGYQSIAVHVADQAIDLPVESYAMVGIPFLAEGGGDPLAIFDELAPYDTKRWRYGVWKSGRYLDGPQAAGHVTPGRSFWIYDKNGTAVAVGGQSTPLAKDLRVVVDPGWNMIANPFAFPLSSDQIARDVGIVADYVSYGSGGYRHFNTTLTPGAGYWVLNLADVTRALTFPIDPVPSVRTKGAATWTLSEGETGWAVDVHAVSAELADPANRFGMREKATDRVDAMDLRDAPLPPEGYLLVSFQDDSGQPLQVDFRGPSRHGAVWRLAVTSDRSARPYELRFDGLETLPADWRLVAVSPWGVPVRGLRDTAMLSGHTAEGGGTRVWHVVAGPEATVEQAIAKIAVDRTGAPGVALAAGPNPFATPGVTTLSLLLGRTGPASLRVYDLSGRLVRTLHDGDLPAGAHAFDWDGKDDDGRSVAAAVYFARARAGRAEGIRKIVLLR